MNIGKLDRRVEIRSRSLVQDEAGEHVESWPPGRTVWAGRMEMTGREFMAASQTIEDTSRVYRIRYRSDVAVTDRLIESGLQFEIHDIRELGRRAGLELQCRALTPAQPIT